MGCYNCICTCLGSFFLAHPNNPRKRRKKKKGKTTSDYDLEALVNKIKCSYSKANRTVVHLCINYFLTDQKTT